MRCIPIYKDSIKCGTLTIKECGLYYEFNSRCNLKEGIYKIIFECKNSVHNLGTLIPISGAMCAIKKLSRQCVGEIDENCTARVILNNKNRFFVGEKFNDMSHFCFYFIYEDNGVLWAETNR